MSHTDETTTPPAPESIQPAAYADYPLTAAIGVSAEKLKELQALLHALPDNPSFCVVIMPDSDLATESLTQRLCGEHPARNVMTLDDSTVLAPGRFLVAPNDAPLELQAGTLRRRKHVDAIAISPIHDFFELIAEKLGDAAIGVLLADAPSDGLRAIADAGGLTIALREVDQSRPLAAPRLSCEGHQLLSTDAIAKELADAALHVQEARQEQSAAQRRQDIALHLQAITTLLYDRVSHEFSHYRTTTLIRRIQRRMHVLRLTSAAAYVERLQTDHDECNALFRELIIGVTSFFRDRAAFDALQKHVVEPLLHERSIDAPIRVWAPGCASGKEAYSLAMLFRETAERLQQRCNVQIFATDIDERALKLARRGSYPLSDLEDIGQQRAQRFFRRVGGRLQVKRELREMILFTAHNVISDPPFSRLDLITCRNLLIYFGTQLQNRLLPLFHSALRPGGYLFLGPSESIESHTDLFKVVDPRRRISQKRNDGSDLRHEFDQTTARALRIPSAPDMTDDFDIDKLSAQVVLNEFAPQYAVVTDEKRVVHLSTGVDKYLRPPSGSFDSNIIRMAREGLRTGLRAALADAIREHRRAERQNLSVQVDGQLQPVTIVVEPLSARGAHGELYVVVFLERTPKLVRPDLAGAAAADTEQIIAQLESDLANTRNDLEATVQELESANEELKSSNEEFLSMNEELQSANEELIAGAIALARSNEDIENLLASTRIATIFLDNDLRIRSFTPAAAEIYNLIESDVGRPLAHITHHIKHMPPVPKPLPAGSGLVIEVDVEAESGEWYRRRVLPYRKSDGSTDGVVITFTDITAIKRVENALRESEGRLRRIANTLPALIAELDVHQRFVFCNSEYESWFGKPCDQIVGATVQDLVGDTVYERLRPMIEIALTGESVTLECRLPHRDGPPRDVLVEYIPKFNEDRIDGFYALIHDISRRKRNERQLTAEHAVSQALVEARSIEEAAPNLLRAICNAFDADVASLWMPNDTDDALVHVTSCERDEQLAEFTRLAHHLTFRRGEPLPGQVWQLSQGVHVGHFGNESAFVRAELAQRFGLRSAMAFPLVSGDDVLGVVELFTREPLAFDQTLLDIGRSIGRDIGHSIIRFRAEEARRESESRFRIMADAAPVLVWIADADRRMTWLNQAWLAFTGRAMEQELGDGWTQSVHPNDLDRCLEIFAGAFERKESFQLDFRLRTKDGDYRWILNEGVPLYTPGGEFTGYIGACIDIHGRRQEEDATQFFAEVSSELASNLDYHTTLQNIARIAVPRFADWCAIDLLGEGEFLERVALHHSDPAKVATVREQMRQYPFNRNAPHSAAMVVRTGEPLLIPDVGQALEEFAFDEEHLRVLQARQLQSLITVPLTARGEVIGALTFSTAESGRRFTQRELEFATDLGRRIGVAIDNVRLHTEISQSEERLSMALEAGRMGAWDWETETGRVRWSPSLYEIHGLTPDQFGGTFEHFQRDMHPDDRPSVLRAIRTALETRTPYHAEYRIVRPDGQEVWVEARGRVTFTDEGAIKGMAGVCADITERKMIESILKQRLQELAIVYRLSSDIATAHEEAEVLDAALKAALEATRAERAAILLRDEEGVMRFRAWHNLSDAYRAATDGHSPWRGDEPNPEPVLIPDALRNRKCAPFREALESEGIRSLAFIPIVHEERLLGKFMLYCAKPHDFPSDEVRLAQTIANHVALALERRRAEQSLIESNRRLQTLAVISNELLQMTEPRQMFDRVFERLSDLLGLEIYFHYVLEPDGESIHLAAWGGLDDETASVYSTLRPGKHICGEVARSREPAVFEYVDSMTDARTAHLRDLGITAYACHPVATSEGVLGTLSFGTRRTPTFDKETIAVLRTACDQIATMMKRNRAETALRQSEERFRAVADAIPDILWSADRDFAWTYVNPRFAALTGISFEESLGRGWMKAVHPADASQVQRTLQRATETGGRYQAELRLRIHNGEDRWFSVRAQATRDSDGAVSGWFGTCTDIDDLKRTQEQNELLVGELNHRVKNTLATVLSISDQTARNARSLDEYKPAFEGRMFALSHAHGLLSQTRWRGAKIRSLLQEVVAPFQQQITDNLRLDGPEVTVSPRIATTLTLAIHELATNAAKYGALSGKMGIVQVSWTVESVDTERTIVLEWREQGGPPVKPPERRGFGTRLLQRSVSYELGGDVALEFNPEGVRCVIQIPLQDGGRGE